MRAFLALAAILLVSAGSARADIAWSAGDLVCDGGMALARFTKGYNDDAPQYEKLPAEVDRTNLSSAPGADRRGCTLSNGWQVRLRLGTDQGFGYGMGGATPPEYFSLWVNHRKVISRMTWAEGYEQSFDDRNRTIGVLVTADSITICKQVDASIVCDREFVTIARMTPDQFEYPPLGIVIPKPGSIKIVVGNGNRLCRAMVRTRKPDETSSPGSIRGFLLNARPVEVSEVGWIDPSPMTPIDTYSWTSMKNGRVGQLDLENDGRPETVIIFSGGTRYFDGSYWILLGQGVSLASVTDEVVPAAQERNFQSAAGGNTQRRWHVYSGGVAELYPGVSPRYVHLDGYTYRGAVYFLAHPTLLSHDPTAMLVRPRANGRMETVCRFQVVRPNF